LNNQLTTSRQVISWIFSQNIFVHLLEHMLLHMIEYS